MDCRYSPQPSFPRKRESILILPGREHVELFRRAQEAGVPVEMHSYATRGHAFGLRRTTFQATAWPDLAETWLRTIGITPE